MAYPNRMRLLIASRALACMAADQALAGVASAVAEDPVLRSEDDAAAAVAVAPRVTLDSIEAKIVREETHVFDGVLTVHVLTMANGFKITGESACASPENFNAELGRDIARRQAIGKAWGFEGYVLREQLSQPIPTEDVPQAA